jgi:S-methylmethionine-dependent homocysteine/selenocysteine methylase
VNCCDPAVAAVSIDALLQESPRDFATNQSDLPKEYEVALIAKPNGGAVFTGSAADWASAAGHSERAVDAVRRCVASFIQRATKGPSLFVAIFVGGCCCTTPDDIREMRTAVDRALPQGDPSSR